MNYVCTIGILIEATPSYMLVGVEDETVKVFYKEFDAKCLEVGTLIKVEGKISNIAFPFDVVLAENVYRPKEQVN